MGRQGGPRAACGHRPHVVRPGERPSCPHGVVLYLAELDHLVASALIVASLTKTFFGATMYIAKLTVFDAVRFYN